MFIQVGGHLIFKIVSFMILYLLKRGDTVSFLKLIWSQDCSFPLKPIWEKLSIVINKDSGVVLFLSQKINSRLVPREVDFLLLVRTCVGAGNAGRGAGPVTN